MTFGADFLDLGSILGPLWMTFRTIFGTFFEHAGKVKIVLPSRREPHFQCRRGSKNLICLIYFDALLGRCLGPALGTHFGRK